MLPNVGGLKFDTNDPNEAFHNCKVRMTSATIGLRGRRSLSSKSAHLTTIPFDPSFIPLSQEKQASNNKKPYLPFSASPSTQRLNNQIQQAISGLKNGGTLNNGVKSDYSFKARAHSHKTGKASISGTQAKSMPYLVDPRITSASKKKTSSESPDRSFDKLNRPSPPKQEGTSAEEIILTGTGKPPLVSGNVALNGSKVQCTRERFQVCRTKEEKEKSPDCIRLDKGGLRIFPDIGGGESITLKLLSLQHNLITRLENVPLLSQLVVLDLYDNRVERICGLQALPSLRVLLLGKNRIKRIEGMDSLKRLEILDLHGNQLRYVDNLGPLSALRVLNLAGNLLRNIRNFGPYGMSSLTELNLKRNRIKNLDGLQKVPHLKRLLIANNDLPSIATLAPLRKLMFLQELVIEPNPLTSTLTNNEYRNQVLTLFPNLSSLDRSPVTDEMKQEAKQWHRKKLAEEEARKEEEARYRQEMSISVGPPGSREQVIYQARRRWESLRNFVKSTNTGESVVKTKPMKTMRSVVSAATAKTSGKPRPNFNELYPPATLDLEHFPDGQVELDKMESLMSISRSPSTLHALDNHKNSEEIEVDKINGQNSRSATSNKPVSFPPQPSSKNELTNSTNAAFSQLAPLMDTSEGNSTQVMENSAFSLTELETTPIDNNLENNSIFVHCNNEVPSTGTDVELMNPSTPKIITDDYDTNDDVISSARSNISITSTKTVSSAKVAVVRPLIRSANEVLEKVDDLVKPKHKTETGSTEEAITRNIALPEEKATLKFHKEANSEKTTPTLEKVGNLPLGDQRNGGATSNTFNLSDTSYAHTNPKPLNKRCDDVGGNESTTLTKNHPKINVIGCEENSLSINNIYDNDKKEESSSLEDMKAQMSNGSDLDENSVKVSSKSVAVNSSVTIKKGKMLRHLRSISLDSGMQPTPQPNDSSGVSNVMSPDDDIGIDEDENENEIQDFQCDYDYDGGADDDAYSIAASTTTTGTSASTTPRRSSTVIATTNRLLKNSSSFRKQTFPRTKSQRLKIRDRAAKLFASSSDLSPRSTSNTNTTAKRVNSGTGARANGGYATTLSGRPSANGKVLRRCDSAISLTSSGMTSANGSCTLPSGNGSAVKVMNGNGGEDSSETPNRKQGVDFLVEVEGKVLNVFGQGGLRHALTTFTSNVTCHVNVAKFHYITFDSIIPFFGKLRQVYPSVEHFHFRSNDVCTLAQLNALSDLQGISSLYISKEGNPIAGKSWENYAKYRLQHWGLNFVNGVEVGSEYRVCPAAQAKGFESLGFLALSCLPQTALTPLARRLHMLHCFCCCSPSTSSDESSRPQRLVVNHNNHRAHSPSSQQAERGSSGNFCTAWDDDPVLLDVIGKEALVYCPPLQSPNDTDGNDQSNFSLKDQDRALTVPSAEKLGALRDQQEKKRSETLEHLIDAGVEIVAKVDKLERLWPTLMTEVIQEILMDYRFMDSYMKKELKKVQDAALIANHHNSHPQHQHGKKIRH